jgi:hypothetical protein
VDPSRSLEVTGRCNHTGGKLVCIGHFDYYGDYMVWTRHFGQFGVAYRVIPYDHPAPETIPEVRLKP